MCKELRVKWKPNWPQVKEHYLQWWRGEGMVAWVAAPGDEPIEAIPAPQRPEDIVAVWTDPKFRCDQATHQLARTYFGADAFPFIQTMIGPGSLGVFLGAEPEFAPSTVWYRPCIDDPDTYGPIRFDPTDNHWLEVHLAIGREAVARADGRFGVGMPDIIENLDTLAAMRGAEELLIDLIERPAWVSEKLAEINQAYFEAFDLLLEVYRDAEGASICSAFQLWGPGRTVNLQCDMSGMISPEMFRRFVIGPLVEQCEWLDQAMYHVDGEPALVHLDALLEIDSLQAIEWTPQFLSVSAEDSGGSRKWWDIYRRIRSAGKSVQAVGVLPKDVAPLLDEFGPAGMYLRVNAPDQAAAEKVEDVIRRFR